MDKVFDLFMNGGTSVAILAYMIYKDNKFNNNLVQTMTEIVVTLKELQHDIERGSNNEKSE